MGVMSVLTVILPPESGEKVSLAITVLLSQILELLVLSDILPPSGENDFPLTGIYVIFQIILVALSVFECVIVTRIYFTCAEKKVPNWLKNLIASKVVHVLVTHDCQSKDATGGGSKVGQGDEEVNKNEFELINKPNSLASRKRIENTGTAEKTSISESENDSLDRYDKNSGFETREWQILAMFIERVFLICYAIFLIVGFLTYLFGMISGR